MATQGDVSVVVTVDDAFLPKIQDVAAALRAAGMRVGSVLGATGIITGEASSSAFASLGSIAGVKAVEQGGEMHTM